LLFDDRGSAQYHSMDSSIMFGPRWILRDLFRMFRRFAPQGSRLLIGQTRGGATALLEFLLAGGGAGIDKDVADAGLFNEPG